MLKAVILIGGPAKGTRFRPLSLNLPKPLFPVAGYPIIFHLIDSCVQVEGLNEVILIGFYQNNDDLTRFIQTAQAHFKIPIRYLQEYTALGTAGGIYHFRDQILRSNPEAFFVLNCDICGDLPLQDMLEFHRTRPSTSVATILCTEATEKQAQNYGVIVPHRDSHEVLHYVEKPETFVSTTINCGVYLFSPEIVTVLAEAFQRNQDDFVNGRNTKRDMGALLHREMSFSFPETNGKEIIQLEQDVLTPLAATGKLFAYETSRFWSQIKSASSAIYSNRHYLQLYHKTYPERLAQTKSGASRIIGDVYIHPSAKIDPTAVLGPNVSIGSGVTIGAGVRVRESIVLENVTLKDHCCIMYSILGWNSCVGAWTRVEGTPMDPDPNKPFAKIDQGTLFSHGRLNPSITIIGPNCTIPDEVIIMNAIVLPDKDLSSSHKNEIIL